MTPSLPVAPGTTRLLRFEALVDFTFGPANASPRAKRSGRRGGVFLTSTEPFANNVVLRSPQALRAGSVETLPVLPRDAWGKVEFDGRRVLFLLPARALGENAAMALFLAAFRERFPKARVGAFCTAEGTDIYLRVPGVEVYPLWIDTADLARADCVIDLGMLESRGDIEIWPVDMEADLLAAFGLPPARAFPAAGRPLRPGAGGRDIAIFPLASSPMRTLPFELTEALVSGLLADGHRVTVSLNDGQEQGRLYAGHLRPRLDPAVKVMPGMASIGALIDAIGRTGFAIFADSGPAHLSKLVGTPGLAVYTSAPGDVLQGRFTNLARYTVDYRGPRCTAPCGLAKPRQAADGRVGCMSSLDVPLEDLPATPRGRQPDLVRRLLIDERIPCVDALSRQGDAVLRAIRGLLAP